MKLRELLSEGLQQDSAMKIIDKFLKFAASELELPQLPKIDLQRDNGRSIEHRSFGGYGGHSITVTLTNRHIMDVCRTLAHELVHYKQDLNDQLNPDSGKDGSPEENEANAMAAVVMRKWGKKHPTLFSQPAVE